MQTSWPGQRVHARPPLTAYDPGAGLAPSPGLAADASTLRSSLLQYFVETFDRYEALFEHLTEEDAFYAKPISLRHPLIFYYGHTATFFVNKLVLAGLLDERVDPKLESILAVGVDEMSWDDLDETHYDWPSVDEVRRYRAEVRRRVTDLIEHAPLEGVVGWHHPWWAIVMGIEHERIHLETSAVLITQQRLDYVRPVPGWEPCRDAGSAPANALVEVPAGGIVLGRPRSDPLYGWDNEYGQHEAEVAAFAASRFLVSNQEFVAFVEAGGYATPRYWDEEGAGWLAFSHATHPTFWREREGDWYLRILAEEIPMPWNWPVCVNYHEASAFCRWKSEVGGDSFRLPTEDEWHRIHDHALATGTHIAAANRELQRYASPCPVDQFHHGDFYDAFGNVWQWTRTPIYPFDGFQVHPLYDDFTVPTFDGLHNVMKGGSWISCGNEALAGSRYAFRRHFFQYAGFRYVCGPEPAAIESSRYEDDTLCSDYLEFHYGEEYFGVPNFPRALAELAVAALPEGARNRALDLGCASGRAAFELARRVRHVVGIDFSARFVAQCQALARGETLRYFLTEEGSLKKYCAADLRALDLLATAPNVEFMQGDACNLKPHQPYDLVLAANLIDRLYDPARFLATVHQYVAENGVLLLASPYTWLEEHTPQEKWLGGFRRDGEPVTTLDTIRQLLRPYFVPIGEPREVPFVIRETRRKFQHTLSEVSLWRRRSGK